MGLRIKPVFFMTEPPKARSILASIVRFLPSRVELSTEAHIKSEEDLALLERDLGGVDAVLELSENPRPVPIRLLIQLGEFGLPVIMYGGQFTFGVRRPEAAGY